MPNQHPRHRILELDPSASLMLDILVESGHLDEPTLNMLNDRLLRQDGGDGLVDLQTIRRVAAVVLTERSAAMEAEARRVLDSEWALLFG